MNVCFSKLRIKHNLRLISTQSLSILCTIAYMQIQTPHFGLPFLSVRLSHGVLFNISTDMSQVGSTGRGQSEGLSMISFRNILFPLVAHSIGSIVQTFGSSFCLFIFCLPSPVLLHRMHDIHHFAGVRPDLFLFELKK